MLVEINLLPKKEQRESSRYILALLIFLLFTASFMIIYLQGLGYEEEMKYSDKQIEVIQKLNAAQQEKMSDIEAGNSAVKLQSAVKWAETYPIESVLLLQKIIVPLPDRGFIRKFEYSGPQAVTIQVQFDAARDAAYYLSSIKHSEWVERVDLLKVAAEKNNEEEAAAEDLNEILPRYLAEYEIVIKYNFFKQNSDEAAKGDER